MNGTLSHSSDRKQAKALESEFTLLPSVSNNIQKSTVGIQSTKFQGRGMSMVAVYGIVKNHWGWISVESEPGNGTAVRIYIPEVAGEVSNKGK